MTTITEDQQKADTERAHAVDDSEVFRQLAYVEEAQRDIGRLLTDLDAELGPVLRPPYDVPESASTDDPEPERCPLSNRLVDLNSAQHRVINHINNIRSRLAVQPTDRTF